MSKCYKCKNDGNFRNHHIDGRGSWLPLENQNNDKDNLIKLCPDCHNIVDGICSKCFRQENCNIRIFKECWNFEDALPPIHFRESSEYVMENLDNRYYEKAICPFCKSNKIKRISKWFYDGIYKQNKNWIAIYNCVKCNKNFIRSLESLYELSIDNKNTPIEINDWNLSAKIK